MAAHKLGMTQPPVSKQMQLLEQELGCELFRRNSRPLEASTPEGKVLYERGSALLAMAQGMVQAVADCRNTQGGTLRLGLVSSVSELAVQRWIAPFGQMHPGVDFALYESNTYSLLERLRRRVIDLALVRTPFPSHGLSHPDAPLPAHAGHLGLSPLGSVRGKPWSGVGSAGGLPPSAVPALGANHPSSL